MNLGNFIIPTVLDNTDDAQESGNRKFQTKDWVWLESYDEAMHGFENKRVTYPTDYAIMNGVAMSYDNKGPLERKSCVIWLRGAKDNCKTLCMAYSGNPDGVYVSFNFLGLCPKMHLDVSAIVSAKKTHFQLFKIDTTKDVNGNILYHTIEFGEYPKTYVGENQNKELEKLFAFKSLRPTGKKYMGGVNAHGECNELYPEFEYKGQKYVRVLTKPNDSDSKYSDGDYLNSHTYNWVKVEPIVWQIRNWDQMPTEINPSGSGKAQYIDVRTEEAIISGIPFYSNEQDKNSSLWQNSTIRGWLNGINVNNIQTNGNTQFTAPNGGNFTGKHNFLAEAFDMELTEVLQRGEKEQKIVGARKSRLEKLNPDTTLPTQRRRMTNTEMIKTWIDAGQSVLLRGPSGIGKTERIRELYPDLIYIKLTNNMFPEKVVGSVNLQTGQIIPPDYAKQALMQCATEEERKLVQENIQNLFEVADAIYERSKTTTDKIVILLDELLNVKPAVQSLVYTLVLNKLVETGEGLKLPANVVVVATGNQKKYSSVAEDLAEPLEKRFDHILDMMPKVGEWLYEYALPHKVHPSVIGYVFNKYIKNMKSEEIEDMGYFYEEPEVGEEHLDQFGCVGRTNDPRGWVSISNALYAFEEDLKNGKFIGCDVESLLKTTLSTKLREEWAADFYDFYNKPTLTVEEVMEKRYTQADLPKNSNEKFVCVAGLLTANEEQVAVCRDFIRKHCDPEYLCIFDLYWAGDNEERMVKIAELQNVDELVD